MNFSSLVNLFFSVFFLLFSLACILALIETVTIPRARIVPRSGAIASLAEYCPARLEPRRINADFRQLDNFVQQKRGRLNILRRQTAIQDELAFVMKVQYAQRTNAFISQTAPVCFHDFIPLSLLFQPQHPRQLKDPQFRPRVREDMDIAARPLLNDDIRLKFLCSAGL